MQTKLKEFGEKLARVTGVENVVHYWHTVTDSPYLIWAETGESDSFYADNSKAEMLINVTVDYWTKTEFDSVVDDLQNLFTNDGFLWSLASVLYEDDTNLIHWSWELVVSV